LREQGIEVSPRAAQQRVLIVDRGSESVDTLQARLTQAGYAVATVDASEQVAAALQSSNPDLVMLDWDFPGVRAIDLIRNIRSSKSGAPPRLIILSMLSADDQIVMGFELGADDYVVKPYSVSELVARVRAVLRSAEIRRDDSPVLRYHKLELWVDEARVRVHDATVPLRSMEYRVLEFLMRNPGRAFSRAALLDRVWGEGCRAQERAVDVVVQRIRKSLAEFGCQDYVQTIRCVGYRLSVTPEPCAAVRAVSDLHASAL
jgi:two-component system phosphate regulon response regulator PhoB